MTVCFLGKGGRSGVAGVGTVERAVADSRDSLRLIGAEEVEATDSTELLLISPVTPLARINIGLVIVRDRVLELTSVDPNLSNHPIERILHFPFGILNSTIERNNSGSVDVANICRSIRRDGQR